MVAFPGKGIAPTCYLVLLVMSYVMGGVSEAGEAEKMVKQMENVSRASAQELGASPCAKLESLGAGGHKFHVADVTAPPQRSCSNCLSPGEFTWSCHGWTSAKGRGVLVQGQRGEGSAST